MRKELYIIRHGETDFNQLGIVQGKGIDSSINEAGKQQAKRFFDAYRNTGFDKIYVSTLKRTFETIESFTHEKIPLIKHAGLDEISWGVHEGKSDGETFKYFYRTLHQWKEGDVNIKIEGGESPLEVQLRQQQFLSELKDTADQKILICSHGRAIRILLCTLLGKPLSDMDTFPHHNLCLYKLNMNDDAAEIELFNDLKHLDEK